MPISSQDLQYMVREPILPGPVSNLMHGLIKHDQMMDTTWYCQNGVIYIDGYHVCYNIQEGDTIKISSEAPVLKVFLSNQLLPSALWSICIWIFHLAFWEQIRGLFLLANSHQKLCIQRRNLLTTRHGIELAVDDSFFRSEVQMWLECHIKVLSMKENRLWDNADDNVFIVYTTFHRKYYHKKGVLQIKCLYLSLCPLIEQDRLMDMNGWGVLLSHFWGSYGISFLRITPFWTCIFGADSLFAWMPWKQHNLYHWLKKKT